MEEMEAKQPAFISMMLKRFSASHCYSLTVPVGQLQAI